MKKLIIWLGVIILIGLGVYFFYKSSNTGAPAQSAAAGASQATTTVETHVNKDQEVIGTSVGARDIIAYHYGTGTSTEILFVGGIHGGYEWNTALVAYQLMDYLKANPSAIPANIKVTVIPVLNPDGLSKVVATTTSFVAADVNPSQTVQVSGRFNGNTVDLNRNFDCDWQASGVWQTKKVSGGSAAFSEPESAAIKTYIDANKPKAVVVWYSSAGGVFSSNCHSGVLPETNVINGIFAKASGYPSHEVFNYYEITGDMVNWLAKEKIPAFSVLLTNHTDTEWDKNLAGIKALLQHYAQ